MLFTPFSGFPGSSHFNLLRVFLLLQNVSCFRISFHLMNFYFISVLTPFYLCCDPFFTQVLVPLLVFTLLRLQMKLVYFVTGIIHAPKRCLVIDLYKII